MNGRVKAEIGGRAAFHAIFGSVLRTSQWLCHASCLLETQADRNRARQQAHLHHGYTLRQIADHLRLHYATVSKAVRAVEARG